MTSREGHARLADITPCRLGGWQEPRLWVAQAAKTCPLLPLGTLGTMCPNRKQSWTRTPHLRSVPSPSPLGPTLRVAARMALPKPTSDQVSTLLTSSVVSTREKNINIHEKPVRVSTAAQFSGLVIKSGNVGK